MGARYPEKILGPDRAAVDPALRVSDHGAKRRDRPEWASASSATEAARATMEEFTKHISPASRSSAWETDQTAFDDLLRGDHPGTFSLSHPSDVQRRDYFEMKNDWCDFPRRRRGADDGSAFRAGGHRTAGSRKTRRCACRARYLASITLTAAAGAGRQRLKLVLRAATPIADGRVAARRPRHLPVRGLRRTARSATARCLARIWAKELRPWGWATRAAGAQASRGAETEAAWLRGCR